MPAITSGKVLVTGTNGYIAVWIAKLLLEAGFSVRGTVRSESKTAHLRELFKPFGDKFETVIVSNMTKVLTRRQAQWSKFLSGFNFTVRYHPSCLGGKPDAVTRHLDIYAKRGDGAFARNNLQNLQTLFSEGQLIASLCATVVLQADVTP